MTTQHTPYDAEIASTPERLKSGDVPRVRLILEASREGYLRAKADYAPLLAAAEAVEWSGPLKHCPRCIGTKKQGHHATCGLAAAIKQAREGAV